MHIQQSSSIPYSTVLVFQLKQFFMEATVAYNLSFLFYGAFW